MTISILSFYEKPMWTKHGFPTERVDKLMENNKAVYHELIESPESNPYLTKED